MWEASGASSSVPAWLLSSRMTSSCRPCERSTTRGKQAGKSCTLGRQRSSITTRTPPRSLASSAERQLWASNAAFLNDSTELVYMGGVLAEIAQELRAKYNVQADIRAYAADAYSGTGRWPAEQRRAASVISIVEDAPTFPGGLFDVYVSCFCSEGDLLSQWRWLSV